MEINPMVIAVVATLASIFSIATTSIGLTYLNKTSNHKKSDKGFLIFNIIISSLVLAVCLLYFGLKFKTRSVGLVPAMVPQVAI